MTYSHAQIVATLGPTSSHKEVLRAMIDHQLDVVRLNFSWGDIESHTEQIELTRKLAKESRRVIPIIIDLPGPRIQGRVGHTYNQEAISALTDADTEFIKFAALHNVEYVAVSFVGSEKDIVACREVIKSFSGKQKIIAKIERAKAFASIDKIIAVSDAIMVARGDLGNEIPLERIPFVQDEIIQKAKKAGKPVIVATQMLLSMVYSPTPTRAEVTDVANAILRGSDAVMLSEETAKGKYPLEAVTMMEKIAVEAERHLAGRIHLNHL